jgi:hypothetical protein
VKRQTANTLSLSLYSGNAIGPQLILMCMCAVHRAGLVHAVRHAPLHCVRAPGAAAAPQATRRPRPPGPAHLCLHPRALSHHLDHEHGRHAALLFGVSIN